MRNQLHLGPTVGLCIGSYGDPGGAGVSYERGTPVWLGTPWECRRFRVIERPVAR